eukprot:jgi/Mesvir1/12702/Mv01700-RA.1
MFLELVDESGGELDTTPDAVISRMCPWLSGSHKMFSVTYDINGKRYAVTYSLEDPEARIRFPPYKSRDDIATPSPPIRKQILSATLGHYVPTDDDEDITDIVEELAGPERDFYERVGYPQHVWCVIRHVILRTKKEFDHKYLRVIYADGNTSFFHPLTGGCMNTGGVSISSFYSRKVDQP